MFGDGPLYPIGFKINEDGVERGVRDSKVFLKLMPWCSPTLLLIIPKVRKYQFHKTHGEIPKLILTILSFPPIGCSPIIVHARRVIQ
jgi:hypothetical protein